MNVSDRNYGMYPVFVFTEDGIFTMSGQTPEAVHASIQAPAFLEAPTSEVICATPYGVAFITKRGLMMINQYSTEFISPRLREAENAPVVDYTGVKTNIVSIPDKTFEEFLSGVKNMLYNPYNDELIITSAESSYSYVYDFTTKQFYASTEKIDLVVRNIFPDLYVIGNKQLKDFSRAASQSAEVAIVTRPLQFGTSDIKQLERVFLRALMYRPADAQIAAYHSLDGVSFAPVKGFGFGNGSDNYKDYDMGLMARETYRYYLFLLTGAFDEQTEIQSVEFEIDKKYNNEKMR
jgi:hypothetical protein